MKLRGSPTRFLPVSSCRRRRHSAGVHLCSTNCCDKIADQAGCPGNQAASLMGSKEGNLGLGHFGFMNRDPRAFVCRALESVLHLVVGFAFVLASVLPAQGMQASHVGDFSSQALAMHDHCKPAGDGPNDENYSVCISGNCQLLTAPRATLFKPQRRHIADFDPVRFAQLVTRATAPPLRPPRLSSSLERHRPAGLNALVCLSLRRMDQSWDAELWMRVRDERASRRPRPHR